MCRNLTRKLVTKVSRNQVRRNFLVVPNPKVLAGAGAGAGAFFAFFAAVGYSTFSFWLLKIELLSLQQVIEKQSAETARKFDKLDMRLDNLEMRLDRLSQKTKQSIEKLRT